MEIIIDWDFCEMVVCGVNINVFSLVLYMTMCCIAAIDLCVSKTHG